MRLRALLGFTAWALIAGSVLDGRVLAQATSTSFLKLERVDVEPYFLSLARVRLFVNPVFLEGAIPSGLKPTDLILEINGVRRKELPGILPFEDIDTPLDLVVVLQTSLRFAPAIEDLQEPLAALLKSLPKTSTRAGLVIYGGLDSFKAYKLADPATTVRKLADVLPEDAPERPELVSAVDKAIKLFKQAPPLASGLTPRRLLFIIGDGSNQDDETDDTHEDVNKKIRLAAAEGVTIHTLAFSMNDYRAPYKNLGQMSKKTAGTFRWAKDRATFAPALAALRQEIEGQLVLGYFLPPELVVDAKIRVLCKSPICGEQGTLASNDRKGPVQPLCAGTVCKLGEACVASACVYAPITGGGSSLGRTLAIGALAVVGLGAGTVVMRRRKTRKQEEAEAAAPPGFQPQQQQVVPQVVVPTFANMPYVSSSAQAQQLQQMAAMMNARGGQPAAQSAPVAALPPGRAGTLFILSGARQGQNLPLRHGFTIGKTPGCDLLIDDGYASGYHAQFHLDAAGGCTVVDMNSTNGTFVNGVRTARQKLSHGMTIRIGGTEVRYLQGQG